MKCIILRGLPGSGKTHVCGRDYPGHVVASADSYFYTDGKYKFNPAFLPLAHAACRQRFRVALQRGQDVIVDNTNLTAGEISWYYNEAIDAGYDVKIVTIDTGFETCHQRQMHGVPLNTLAEMYRHFKNEVLPPWWDQEVLLG